MRLNQTAALFSLTALLTCLGCDAGGKPDGRDTLATVWTDREAVLTSRLDSTRAAIAAMRTRLQALAADSSAEAVARRTTIEQKIAEREKELASVDQMILSRRTARETALRAESPEDLDASWLATEKEYNDAIARLDLILGDIASFEPTLEVATSPVGNPPDASARRPRDTGIRLNRNTNPTDTSTRTTPSSGKNDGKGIELNRN